MLVDEILKSAEVIPDLYLRAVTYARIGERLSAAGNGLWRTAFLKALETAKDIEDPVSMFDALLVIAHALSNSRTKSSRKMYLSILEDSKGLAPGDRDVILKRAVELLILEGKVSDAITFASEISDSTLREQVFLGIIRANNRLMGRGKLEKAYGMRKSKLAFEYINNEPFRSKALFEIIKGYLMLGSYQTAISLLQSMGDERWAKQTFKEIVFHLKDRELLGHFIDLLEEAAENLGKKFGRRFTEELALAFALSGEGVVAVSMVRKIREGQGVLNNIAVELLKRDGEALPNFIGALNEDEASGVGRVLMNVILENPREKYRKIVDELAKATSDEAVLAKVARYYVLIADLESALTLGRRMRDPRLRSLVLADVARELLKRNRVEEAIDIALEVRDREFSSLLISEILVKALEKELGRGNYGKAKAVGGEKTKLR